MASPVCRVFWLLSLCALFSCREGSNGLAGGLIPVLPTDAGTQGCWPLSAFPGTATNVYGSAAIGPMSQIAAVAGEERLYYTGGDGSIHVLDFPMGGGAPIDTVLVSAGAIATDYLQPAGIMDPAVLSGIAILDEEFLAVAEHASNTLIAVNRDSPDTFFNLAGRRDANGGFAPVGTGAGGEVRFHFTEPVPLMPDARGFLYVGDTENHALRRVQIPGIAIVETIAGTGAPGSGFGPLPLTEFDTPSGLVAACTGELYLMESGAAGLAGNRLLSLEIGGPSFFGGLDGSSLPLAGNGTNATLEGVGPLAGLGTPMGLVSTEQGELYWMDAKEGILRRFDLQTGLCDCPMFVDCATAVVGPSPFGGTRFSIAIGDSGVLYVLSSDTQTLFRVDL